VSIVAEIPQTDKNCEARPNFSDKHRVTLSSTPSTRARNHADIFQHLSSDVSCGSGAKKSEAARLRNFKTRPNRFSRKI